MNCWVTPMALPKLIVVLGTTACGKSGLGVELAKRFGGEIVSADSRQVYRSLDLGTGKVTEEEMEGVPHHMLDVVEPNQPYSVAEFQAGAYRPLYPAKFLPLHSTPIEISKQKNQTKNGQQM